VIIGIGVDLVDVRRFAAVCDRTPALVERCFTAAEQVGPVRWLAGSFAAKEAIAKALDAPPGLRWQDAEVLRTETGRPHLVLRGAVAAAAEARGIQRWHLSLSHDGPMVVAMAVAES
jgi:holo-[acyl-carrier protein] synthase